MNKDTIQNLVTVACLLAALVMGMFLTSVYLAPESNASRPIHGHKYKDECKNMPGVQPIYFMKGYSAIPRYREVWRTPRPNDCVPTRRFR